MLLRAVDDPIQEVANPCVSDRLLFDRRDWCPTAKGVNRVGILAGGTPAFDVVEDVDIQFALEAGEILADAQVIDDLQNFPASFDLGSGKISVIGGSINEEVETLTLLNQIPSQSEIRLTSGNVRAAVEQTIRFYRHATRIAQMQEGPTELIEFASKIGELHESISLIRVVIVTGGIAPSKSFDEYIIDGSRVKTEIYDKKRMDRAAGYSISREDIDVNFEDILGCAISCLAVRETEHSDYDTYLAAIPGNALCSMYAEYNTRLLELNVRAFLGVRGKKTANAGLRETLLKEPGHFLAYNNGIVATVDALELTPDRLGIKALTRLAIQGLRAFLESGAPGRDTPKGLALFDVVATEKPDRLIVGSAKDVMVLKEWAAEAMSLQRPGTRTGSCAGSSRPGPTWDAARALSGRTQPW